MIYPLNRLWSKDYYVMALANLLARMMGAKPRLDENGFPVFPQGYADPLLKKRYPQHSAELMGAYIPEKKFTIKRINSLDQAVIGPLTAYELGWISKRYAKKTYAGFQ